MDKQIQKLNDDSVAQVAMDHPCMHEWLQPPFGSFHICKICEFILTNSEFNRYKELEKEKEND